MKIFGVFLHKNDIYGHLTMLPSKQQSTNLFRIVLGRENGWYNEEWGEVTCKRSNLPWRGRIRGYVHQGRYRATSTPYIVPGHPAA
jgi:hypothetical protein